MARDEYNWLDDAFDESKPDPLAKKGQGAHAAAPDKDYDWIDDAFDDRKVDPLASKGFTGCSPVAVVLAIIIVLVLIGCAVLGTMWLGEAANTYANAIG